MLFLFFFYPGNDCNEKMNFNKINNIKNIYNNKNNVITF